MNFLFPYLARWRTVNWTRYHQLFTRLADRGHDVYVLQPPASNMPETNFQEIEVEVPGRLHLIEVPVNDALWQAHLPLNKLLKKGYYAVECSRRIVENRGGVCDRQIINIGSPSNEVSIRQMAEMMREIYAEKFRDPRTALPDIVSVTGEEFYGAGYDDSDRRIPDVTKARTLLGWNPRWNLADTLEATMHYFVAAYRGAATEVLTVGD